MNIAARPYSMEVRARRAQATAERIVEAAISLFWERAGEFSLDDVAAAAGVTVQTVIRHFGGRDGLMAAGIEHELERVARERDPAAISSAAEAVDQLVEHYERIGDGVVALLGLEASRPALKPALDHGRAFHRRWCEQVFAESLGRLDADTRRRRLAQLVALCDVQTWRLLRRDARLSRAQTALAMLEMVSPLLEDR